MAATASASITSITPKVPQSYSLSDAASRDDRVFFCCLSCGRSRDARAAVFITLLGALPFGMIVGKLRCKGCTDNFAVVLPWYAPTPRAWANQYRPQDPPATPDYIEPPRSEFIYQVESLNPQGRIVETRTLTRDLNLAHVAFEMKLETVRPGVDRYWLRDGSRLMRDSARDLKAVK
jgi:hypothetical protein